MSETREYFKWLRWNLSERDIQDSWIRDRGAWFASLVLVGTLLGMALMLWLVLLGQRDSQSWQGGKQDRAGKVGTALVMNREEWIR